MGLLDKNDHGVSQLIDSPNTWAAELWKKGCANHWLAHEVNMTDDIKQWKDPDLLSEDERLLVKRILGLFSAGESLVSNSVDTVEFKYITDGNCRQYLMRKQFEESVHNWTVAVCCEAYQLDVSEVAEAYLSVPAVKQCQEFLTNSLDSFDGDFDIETTEGKQQFIKNLFVFYLICEGTWFFTSFALIMSLGRQNKLPGLSDQILYTARDESLHVEFGVNVLNATQKEYPEVWTDAFRAELHELMSYGLSVGKSFAKSVCPEGILGVNTTLIDQYLEFIANIRLQSIGMKPTFEAKTNPFPWVAEALESQGMSAFFERREKSYQHEGVLDDDL